MQRKSISFCMLIVKKRSKSISRKWRTLRDKRIRERLREVDLMRKSGIYRIRIKH